MAHLGRLLAIGALALTLTAARKPQIKTIAIDGLTFQPADVTVSVGDTVVWVNKDPFPHNVTSKDGAFHSKSLDPKQAFRFHATKAGTFPYVCTLHPTMAAVIHVN